MRALAEGADRGGALKRLPNTQAEVKEWLIKERIKWSLGSLFSVRLHATLILLGAIVIGWAADRLLFLAGVGNLLARLPAGVVAAYAGFLLGIEAWIRYSGIRDYVNWRRSKELLDPPGFETPEAKDPNWFTSSIAAYGLEGIGGEGCFLVIVVVFVMLLLFTMGGYLIVVAADLFAEVVFELLLVAGLIRGIRRVDLLGLTGGIPKITLPAFAFALAVSILVGLWARVAHPEARTLAQAIAAEAANH